MFKSIGRHLTTIFDKTQKVNSGFNLTNREVNNLVVRFNKLNSQQNFGKSWIIVNKEDKKI